MVAAELPNPALIVLNKDDATLVIVNPKDGKVVGKTPVGEGPHEVTVSSDGKTAFVSNYGTGPKPGNSISVIDLVTAKEVKRFVTAPFLRPHGIEFVDGKVLFTAEANKLIARYDPATDKIDWALGTGQNTTHMVMATKDRLFTANIGSDTITIIDRANMNETVVPVGQGPEAMDLSPDGTQLWTAHSRDGGVSVIDIVSKKVVQTFSAKTKRSNRLKFTTDGKRVLITDLAAGELVVLDVATRSEVKRMVVGKSPEGILMEPSGARAYVAVNGDHFIAVVDLKTLEVVSKIQSGNGPDGMAWVERK